MADAEASYMLNAPLKALTKAEIGLTSACSTSESISCW